MAANRRTDGVVVGSTRGNAESRQAAQQIQAREERRRQAEARAKQLVSEARAAGTDMVVRHTLELDLEPATPRCPDTTPVRRGHRAIG